MFLDDICIPLHCTLVTTMYVWKKWLELIPYNRSKHFQNNAPETRCESMRLGWISDKLNRFIGCSRSTHSVACVNRSIESPSKKLVSSELAMPCLTNSLARNRLCTTWTLYKHFIQTGICVKFPCACPCRQNYANEIRYMRHWLMLS